MLANFGQFLARRLVIALVKFWLFVCHFCYLKIKNWLFSAFSENGKNSQKTYKKKVNLPLHRFFVLFLSSRTLQRQKTPFSFGAAFPKHFEFWTFLHFSFLGSAENFATFSTSNPSSLVSSSWSVYSSMKPARSFIRARTCSPGKKYFKDDS